MNILDMKIIGFRQDVRTFLKSKSNWTGLTMIFGGAIGIYQKANLTVSVQAIMGGLALIFVKDSTI